MGAACAAVMQHERFRADGVRSQAKAIENEERVGGNERI